MDKDFKEVKTQISKTQTTTTFEVTVTHAGSTSKTFKQIFECKKRRARVDNWEAKVIETKTETKTKEKISKVSIAHLRADNRAIRQSIKEAADKAGLIHVTQKTPLAIGAYQLTSSFKFGKYGRKPYIQVLIGVTNRAYESWKNPRVMFIIDGENLTSNLWVRSNKKTRHVKATFLFANPNYNTKLISYLKMIKECVINNKDPYDWTNIVNGEFK